MTVAYAAPSSTATVTLAGDADDARARLQAELEALDGSGAAVSVNLDGVDRIDSPLLAALVLGMKRLERHGGALTVIAQRPDVLRLLGQTGLDRILLPRS
jgi:anti-anti-sigma factor